MIILPNNLKNGQLNKNISIGKKADRLIELLKSKNFSELEKINISIKDLKLIGKPKLKIINDLLNQQVPTGAEGDKLSLLKEKIKNLSKQKSPTQSDIKESADKKSISKNIDKAIIKSIKDDIVKIEKNILKTLSSSKSENIDKTEAEKKLNQQKEVSSRKSIANIKKDLTNLNNPKATDVKAAIEKVKDIFNNIKTSFKKLEKTFQNDFATQKELIKDIAGNLEKITKEIFSKPVSYSLKDQEVDKIIKDIKESVSKLKNLASEPLNKPAKFIENQLDKILYNALKNGETSKLKLLSNSNINSQLENLTKQIKDIENLIETKPDFKKYAPALKKFTAGIENIDLKNSIKDSGVFFESKLKEIALQKESNLSKIESDLKNILQHIDKDAKNLGEKTLQHQTQKAISHIETLQLNSVINSNINLFIPFSWEDLENGSLSLSRQKDKSFSCKIDLNLKKHGNIDILMLLSGYDISIGIDAKDEHFKDILANNKNILSKMLKSINLNPHIFFHTKQKEGYSEETEMKLGVNLKA